MSLLLGSDGVRHVCMRGRSREVGKSRKAAIDIYL